MLQGKEIEGGIIILDFEIDREQQSEYNLVANAIDETGLSSTTNVRIIIQDVNDNIPRSDLDNNS